MGGTGASAGGSPSFNIPGQSAQGSARRDGLQAFARGAGNIATILAQKELVAQQNEASRLARLEQVPTSPPAGMDPVTQKYEKGKFQAYDKRHPERSKNVMSPMTKVRLGSQEIWVPVEEVDSFIEDPLKVSILTMAYVGNKGVDWQKVYTDYTGKRRPITTRRLTDYHRRKAIKKSAKQIRTNKRVKVYRLQASDPAFYP